VDPDLVMALRAQVVDELGVLDAQLRALMLRADVLRQSVVALDALAELAQPGAAPVPPRAAAPLRRRADLHPDPGPPPPEEPPVPYDRDLPDRPPPDDPPVAAPAPYEAGAPRGPAGPAG